MRHLASQSLQYAVDDTTAIHKAPPSLRYLTTCLLYFVVVQELYWGISMLERYTLSRRVSGISYPE
jgi:hypothetical protein